MYEKDGNKIITEIEDNGSGIPDDVISKIFEPLFTTKQEGTGLGLSSCKSIIEQHNGTITVKNNPTVFTIELPKDPLIEEELLK
jgi:signal transduction histidine kinase